MLHNEARKLLVEGYEATHNAEAIAKIFHVNKYTVYHLEERKRKTGSVDLQTWRRGRKALLSSADKARIAERITKNSTISLGELRTQLGLKVSISTMSRVVRALGFRVKKVGLSATERERPRCAGKTYQVERVKAPPHNSAARLAMPFPPSAACKFLDLPPVNLRNLHLHLTKNPFASRPPHLCGVTLNFPQALRVPKWRGVNRSSLLRQKCNSNYACKRAKISRSSARASSLRSMHRSIALIAVSPVMSRIDFSSPQ